MFPFTITTDPYSNESTVSKTTFIKKTVSSMEELAETITCQNWSPASSYKYDYRKKANWEGSSIIALDFDDGLSLNEAKNIFSEFKCIIGTTKSHGREKNGITCDRFRVVFPLSKINTDRDSYEKSLKFAAKKYGSDTAATDSSRYFFACTSIEFVNEHGSFFDERATVQTVEISSKKKWNKITENFINHGAAKGKFNKELYKVCSNLNDCGFSTQEAINFLNEKLVKIPGFYPLDSRDLATLESAFKKEANPEYGLVQKNQDENLLEVLFEKLKDSFVFYQAVDGQTSILKKNKHVVSASSLDSLREEVYHCLKSMGRVYTAKQIANITDTFLLDSAKSEMRIFDLPPSISTNENELAFNHVNISNLTPTETPAFDEFLANCAENAEALCAFIWSLLEPKQELQQYIMMRGQGGDGKGSIAHMLQHMLGDKAVGTADVSDNHWLSSCVGKRLIFVQELNNTSAVMSSKFKSVVGNDLVSISQKYEKSFNTKLDCRFILSTNAPVNVETRKSELRRIIYVEIKQPKTIIPNFKQKLVEEIPGILCKCKIAFNNLYNKETHRIECSYETFSEAASEYEMDETVIFDKYMKISPDSKIPATAFTTLLNAVLPKKTPFDRNKFKDWLCRTHSSVRFIKIQGARFVRGISLTKEAQLYFSGEVWNEIKS